MFLNKKIFYLGVATASEIVFGPFRKTVSLAYKSYIESRSRAGKTFKGSPTTGSNCQTPNLNLLYYLVWSISKVKASSEIHQSVDPLEKALQETLDKFDATYLHSTVNGFTKVSRPLLQRMENILRLSVDRCLLLSNRHTSFSILLLISLTCWRLCDKTSCQTFFYWMFEKVMKQF